MKICILFIKFKINTAKANTQTNEKKNRNYRIDLSLDLFFHKKIKLISENLICTIVLRASYI